MRALLHIHLYSSVGLHLLMPEHTKPMRLGIINLTPADVALQLKFSSQSGYGPNHGLLIFRRIKCNPICHAYTKAYCSTHNVETQKRKQTDTVLVRAQVCGKSVRRYTGCRAEQIQKAKKSNALYKVSTVEKKKKKKEQKRYFKIHCLNPSFEI